MELCLHRGHNGGQNLLGNARGDGKQGVKCCALETPYCKGKLRIFLSKYATEKTYYRQIQVQKKEKGR